MCGLSLVVGGGGGGLISSCDIIAVASLVVEHGLWSMQASVAVAHRLSCSAT